MEEPPHNLQDLIDLLLISQCQIAQDTLTDLVESKPGHIRALLATRGDLHNIRQMVLMLWLISVLYQGSLPLKWQQQELQGRKSREAISSIMFCQEYKKV